MSITKEQLETIYRLALEHRYAELSDYLDSITVPEGWQVVPVEPTREMIEDGAQRLVSWEDGCVWPDSWSPLQVSAARNEADRVWRSMWLAAAPKPGDSNAPEKSRSQRLREAGFTRRPTWRSLPKDGDAESDKEPGDSNE